MSYTHGNLWTQRSRWCTPIFCPPPWPETKEKSFAEQMNFLRHRLGQFPTSGVNSIFHCAIPRGLIRWVTVWDNSPLLGLNSIFHPATPRGLIRWVTVWDNSLLLGLNSIKHPAIPRGLICDTTVGGNFPLIALLVDGILPRVGRRLPHKVNKGWILFFKEFDH